MDSIFILNVLVQMFEIWEAPDQSGLICVVTTGNFKCLGRRDTYMQILASTRKTCFGPRALPSHQRRMLTRWQRHHNGGRAQVLSDKSVGGLTICCSAMDTANTDKLTKSLHNTPDSMRRWWQLKVCDHNDWSGFSACPVLHICFPGVNRADQSDTFSAIDTSTGPIGH